MRENRANGLQIVNAKVELMKDLDIIAFGNAIVDTIIPLITDILQTFLGGGITF